MKTFRRDILVILAVLSILGAKAFADTAGGIQRATAPLVRSGVTVSMPAASASVDGYLTAANFVMFSNGAGGSGGALTVTTNFQSTVSTCAVNFPIDDTRPTTTEGCRVATLTYTAASATSVLEILGNANIASTAAGAEVIACWISLDSSLAVSLSSVYLPAGGTFQYVGQVHTPALRYAPGNTSAHTISMYCGSDSTNAHSIYVNASAITGGAPPDRAFGGSMRTGLTVLEGGSGSGGGSVSDPLTVNGWTPGSGTATLTGAEVVTGAVTFQSTAAFTGAATFSSSITGAAAQTLTYPHVVGSTDISSPILKNAAGELDIQPATRLKISPAATRGVRLNTSGSKETCNSGVAGNLFFEVNAAPTSDHLYLCASAPVSGIYSWQTLY